MLLLVLAIAGFAAAADGDGDGWDDSVDNCATVANDQSNADGDSIGDACECGDIDGNGYLNIVDAQLLLSCARGEFPCVGLCDASGDGVCDLYDALQIWRAYSGQITKKELRCAARGAPASCTPTPEYCDGRDNDCDGLIDVPGCGCFELRDADRNLHVLQRTAYGPDAWSRSRIEEIGLCGYINEQLDPQSIDDAPLEAKLAGFKSLDMSYQELRETYPKPLSINIPGLGNVAIGKIIPLQQLGYAKVLRAGHGRRQLEAVLTDFWFNHFNVYGPFNRRHWDTVPYERDVILPNVLRRFEDLMLATAQAPAMLDYLDNSQNVRNGFIGAQTGRSLNENYGREVLELHTVGVDAGYTQSDVVDLSRALTGWQFHRDAPNDFWYRDEAHDQGAKEIFGLSLPENGGIQDGLQALSHLANHISTAHHLTSKLITRFVSEEAPPPALQNRAAFRFFVSGGQLEELMRALLFSREFLLEPAVRQSKVKRPHHFMASIARATGADLSLTLGDIPREIKEMGEPLHAAVPATGYPENSDFWASPGGLVERWTNVQRIVSSLDGWEIGLDTITATAYPDIVDALIEKYFPYGVSDATRDGAIALLTDIGPSSQGKRVEQAAAFLFTSPESMLH